MPTTQHCFVKCYGGLDIAMGTRSASADLTSWKLLSLLSSLFNVAKWDSLIPSDSYFLPLSLYHSVYFYSSCRTLSVLEVWHILQVMPMFLGYTCIAFVLRGVSIGVF